MDQHSLKIVVVLLTGLLTLSRPCYPGEGTIECEIVSADAATGSITISIPPPHIFFSIRLFVTLKPSPNFKDFNKIEPNFPKGVWMSKADGSMLLRVAIDEGPTHHRLVWLYIPAQVVQLTIITKPSPMRPPDHRGRK